MSILSIIFNELLYRPLFNGLVFLYNILPGHDLGIAIIVLTVALRLLMYPLFQKSIKSQKELAVLQPKIKELQKKYHRDKEKQAKALMGLYKEHGVNPMSGCLPLLIQLPILFAFFRVLWTGLDPNRLNGLYWFVKNPGMINPLFLGLINLAEKSPLLAILAGIAQFIQSKMTMPKRDRDESRKELDFAQMMSTQMVYMMPILTVLIAWNLPAGLPLYWLTLTVFGIGQQYLTMRKKNNLATEEKSGKMEDKIRKKEL